MRHGITKLKVARPNRPLRTMALVLAVLAASSCSEASDAPAAEPSVEGLEALADAVPEGTDAVGWRVLEGFDVPAWLFYPVTHPAEAQTPSAGQPLLPDSYATGLRRRFGPIAGATLIAAPGHALHGAAMAAGTHPLIVFAPGAAMGGRDYRLFAEALAARGRAVLVLRPTGSPGASDERYAEAADEIATAIVGVRGMTFVQGEGQIDAARPVLVGHSLGGAAAVLAAARTGACAVNIDGDFGGATAEAGPSGPLLYIIGDPDLDRAADVARRAEVWRKVAGYAGGQAVALALRGMRHFDLADAAPLPPGVIPEERRTGRFGSIGGAAARRALVDLVEQFAAHCSGSGTLPLKAVLRLPPDAPPIFVP